MGGCCCCCSRERELNSSPPFYHYPRVSEEHQPLSSHTGTATVLSTGFLVDPNLETSIPDTYRPPPAPIPYDANSGRPRIASANQSVEESNTGISYESTPNILNKSDVKVQSDAVLDSSKEVQDELEKSGELKKSNEPIVLVLEEEECCPTCLEEYDAENPKIITKCEHHFHLACILEWLERSDTCPVCDQEMIFDPTADG
ncbi:putative E3 ubiquitin-protein ligase RHB1A [Apium graveolens]|uniref:putative E3 ubiquitin-protein ligase RHB1A n=1 Tax=Apium graveolens TaxID=4045 RepID=UPI003D7AAA69